MYRRRERGIGQRAHGGPNHGSRVKGWGRTTYKTTTEEAGQAVHGTGREESGGGVHELRREGHGGGEDLPTGVEGCGGGTLDTGGQASGGIVSEKVSERSRRSRARIEGGRAGQGCVQI